MIISTPTCAMKTSTGDAGLVCMNRYRMVLALNSTSATVFICKWVRIFIDRRPYYIGMILYEAAGF